MTDLISLQNRIMPMTPNALDRVYKLQNVLTKMPQTEIDTQHIIHGGMYARTVFLPAHTVITGALIKTATLLIVCGHALVYIDDKPHELTGYQIFAASAKRKQAFVALRDTYLTMIFPTSATTVEQAENEFTDEAAMLLSRQQPDHNHTIITGE